MCKLQKLVVFAVLTISVCMGCTGSRVRTSLALTRYLNVPLAEMPVHDDEAFWRDEEFIFRAAMKGDEEAIRAYLRIYAEADGAVAEQMGNEIAIMHRYPDLCGRIIHVDPELRENRKILHSLKSVVLWFGLDGGKPGRLAEE